MKAIVKNAGSPSSTSWKLIFLTTDIINTPVIISVVAVAAEGITEANGAINIASINKNAVTTPEKPVLPPSTAIAVLSTNVETDVTPIEEPTTVAIASASSVFLIFSFVSSW